MLRRVSRRSRPCARSRRVTTSAPTAPATTSVVAATTLEPAARLLGAADVYVALTTDRADRPARSGTEAATELRELGARGVLDRRMLDAVLGAAGHAAAAAPKRRRSKHPAGLSEREVEVLCLAAKATPPARSASASSSPRKQPIITSNTCTTRSVFRRAAPPRCGRCKTDWWVNDLCKSFRLPARHVRRTSRRWRPEQVCYPCRGCQSWPRVRREAP